MPRVLPRRTVLRGLGGVAVGLPFLEAMRTKQAMAAAPKRYIQLATPLGLSPGQWYTGSNSAIAINPSFAGPLQAHTSDLLLVRGGRSWNAASGHAAGVGAIFTGRGGDTGYGISLDQEIAKLNKGARFPSLHFGFFTSTSTATPGQTHTLFAGANQPINSTNDPRSMFKTLFGSGGTTTGGGAGEIDKALARKKSVLDLVRGDFNDVKVGLSTSDKQRLTDHAEFVRAIELSLMQLDQQPAATTSCSGPDGTAINAIQLNEAQGAAISRAQTDLIVMAAACDLSRVITMQWSFSVAGLLYKWLEPRMKGISAKNHHGWTHSPDTGNWSVGLPYFRTIEKWYLEEVGRILDGLKANKVFDDTLVVWGTNEPRGQHGVDEQGRGDRMYVIAQAAGGYFKTGGRVADFQVDGYKAPTARWDYSPSLLIHVAKAFGYTGTKFGADYFGQGGPAPGLTA